MTRSAWLAALAATLCCTAAAQGVRAERVSGPVRNAGIYHVATGTWTRGPGVQANVGPDVIYNADAPSGYFGIGWEGAEAVDECALPGTAHPKGPGPQSEYRIDGFEFAYCTESALPIAWRFTFYDSYVPCDDPDVPANCINPVAAVLVVGLPHGGGPGVGACWTVTVDLQGSGYEFCMAADGGPCAPGYQGGGVGLDHAGWGATCTVLDGNLCGPVIAGYDPSWSVEGEGTCYDPNLTCTGATGLGAQDQFAIGSPFNGCFWFGGYKNTNGCGNPPQTPGAQFFMRLRTDCTTACSDCPDKIYCDTNPNNAADITISSCDCSDGSILVCMSGGPANQFAYLLIGRASGTVTDPPGASGDLCLAGDCIGRYDKDAQFTDANGAVCTDILNANSGGGGGNVPTCGGNICLPSGQTFNFQYWHRDGMNPSKFSKALTATFK